MADIKTSLGEDSVKLDEHRVMDFELARVENITTMEPEKEDMANIFILGVEAGPMDKEIKENENNVFECQEVQHQLLWKNLELTKPYLETEVMADIKTSLGKDSVKLDEHMVMDFELSGIWIRKLRRMKTMRLKQSYLRI